jgi:hypothetical protein
MMIDDFIDMMNKICINNECDHINSWSNQDFSCFEELLFSIKKMQESQWADESDAHLIKMYKLNIYLSQIEYQDRFMTV